MHTDFLITTTISLSYFCKMAFTLMNMDNWQKFNVSPLPKNKDFYSHLNKEDIADAEYAHTQKEFVIILK